MNFTILIPARLASTRLPNKPLADIHGAPMVVRVAQRAALAFEAVRARQVVVACDHESIATACAAHGVQAVLTRPDHASGSDRLAEACEKLGLRDDEIVVNVQGDEPLIAPQLIREVADLLEKHATASMGTAAHAIETEADRNNPNIVKVVLNANNEALYFSRSLIPFNRDSHPLSPQPLRHVGIYSYRVGFLKQFPKLPQAPIEVSEALEQLRALWHGYTIAVHVSAATPAPGVDTPADLELARKLWQASVQS